MTHSSLPAALPSRGGGVIIPASDVPASFAERMRMAEVLASARNMVPEHYQDDPGAVMAAMMHAQTLDISVWLAMQMTFVEKGRVGMESGLMHGLLLRAGHKIEIAEETPQSCRLRLIRWDDPRPHLYAEFTIADAMRANLMHKHNWQRYPADMLFARALARLARRWAREVVLGFGYVRDELEEMDATEPILAQDAVQARASDEAIATAVADLVGRARALLKAEGADPGDLDAIAADAKKRALLHSHTDNGQRLRDALLDVRRELLARTRAQQVDDTDEAATDPEMVGDALTDADTLGCGCRKIEVIANGDHAPGCHLRVSSPMPSEEPADVEQ